MKEQAAKGAKQSSRRRFVDLLVFGLVVAYASLLAATFFMGIWLVGKDGKPVATDFVSFWSAGRLVLEGQASNAYDWAIHKQVATAHDIHIKGYFSFQYPPTFLILTPAFALVSYPLALFLWNIAGAALYASAIRIVTGGWNATLAALAWPAVLWNMVVGQTGFLTAALLGTGIALVDRRPALSGILFGLLTYKPQFGLLIPVALIAGGRWRVILWAVFSAITLAALSTALFGVPVWAAFIESLMRVNEAILTAGGTGFSKLQSVYGYLRSQGLDGATAWTVHGLFAATLAAIVAWAWRSEVGFEDKAAILSICTILASPYAFIYDLVALAVPLAFLGRTGFSGRELAFVAIPALLVAWGPADQIATGLLAGVFILGLVVSRLFAAHAAVRHISMRHEPVRW